MNDQLKLYVCQPTGIFVSPIGPSNYPRSILDIDYDVLHRRFSTDKGLPPSCTTSTPPRSRSLRPELDERLNQIQLREVVGELGLCPMMRKCIARIPFPGNLDKLENLHPDFFLHPQLTKFQVFHASGATTL